MTPGELAFVGACVWWAHGRRRDLPTGLAWLAALLCCDDWLAARARGREAWRRLVLRDLEEAARAARSVLFDPSSPESESESVALCIRAAVEDLRPAGRGAWIDRPSPKQRRKVARILRRSRRGPGTPAGGLRLALRPWFPAALGTALASCPLLSAGALAHTGRGGSPGVDLDGRPALQLALVVMDRAAFHHSRVRGRGYPAGSCGNDIIDRARAYLEADPDPDALRELFARHRPRKGGSR